MISSRAAYGRRAKCDHLRSAPRSSQRRTRRGRRRRSRCRAEHHFGGLRCGRAAADLMQLLSAQMRQRQSERLKVVEEKNAVEVRGARQAFGGEGPSGIGELDLAAGERRRHGDGASAWTLFQPGKIDLGGSFDACMLGAGKLPDLRQLEGFEIGESEAGIGAADIGNEGAGARVCGFSHNRRLVTQFVIGSEGCRGRPGQLGSTHAEGAPHRARLPRGDGDCRLRRALPRGAAGGHGLRPWQTTLCIASPMPTPPITACMRRLAAPRKSMARSRQAAGDASRLLRALLPERASLASGPLVEDLVGCAGAFAAGSRPFLSGGVPSASTGLRFPPCQSRAPSAGPKSRIRRLRSTTDEG